MKTISISEIEITNFRSFVSARIPFPKTYGLRSITGTNEIEPRLGANGCGKTSLLEALVWCLYGSGIKGAKTSSVISWGKEEVAVITNLVIDGQVNSIRRYGPPTKVELNGNPVEQPEIDKLLGLSKQRFLNSVIFGQAAVLFPDLSTPERSDLLDGVLNLGIWQTCAEKAAEKTKALESELNARAVELSFIEGKLVGLATEEELENNVAFYARRITEWEDETTDSLSDLEAKKAIWENDQLHVLEGKAEQVEKFKLELTTFQETTIAHAEANNEKALVDEIARLDEILTQCSNVIALAAAVKKDASAAKVFWKQSICPACSQNISEKKKETQLAELNEKSRNSDIEAKAASKTGLEKRKRLDVCRKELQIIREAASLEAAQRRTIMRDSARVQSQINLLSEDAERILNIMEQGLDPFSKQITHLKKSVNPYIQQREQARAKLQSTAKERDKLSTQKTAIVEANDKLRADMVAVEYWKHGFKHIRLYFVQQILSVLQIEIQSATSALGLEGWEVKLQTETETKSGTTKLGINIIINSPVAEGSWDNWSGGETQRLRLAIAIGLASLIQRAAGVFYTIEFYDEQSKALSQQGIEDFLEVLRTRAEVMKKQIFIVDHSNIQFAGFDETWNIIKTKEGSEVVQ